MFGRLFKRAPPPLPRSMIHPTLGEIEFDASGDSWEFRLPKPSGDGGGGSALTSAQDAGVYFGGIPGDAAGPHQKSVDELLARLANVSRYWAACADDLLTISGSYDSLPKVADPREIYEVTALSLYRSHWEICFKTKDAYKWLYVGMQFEGEELVSNTIDT